MRLFRYILTLSLLAPGLARAGGDDGHEEVVAPETTVEDRLFGEPAAAGAITDPDKLSLAEYRNAVLDMRVRDVLLARARALRACHEKKRLWRIQELALKIEHRAGGDEPAGARTYSTRQASVQELMELLQQTEEFNDPLYCYTEIKNGNQALWMSERRMFQNIGDIAKAACVGAVSAECYRTVARLVRQIDPHCYSHVIRDRKGGTESNPCFAGDHLVTDTLAGDDVQLKNFVARFAVAVAQGKEGETVDPWQLWLKDNKDSPLSRKKFLASIAYLTAAATSNSGYVDGFGDTFWRTSLERGRSPQQAFEKYTFMRQQKDAMNNLLYDLHSKKLNLKIGEHDFNDANRHDYMAAFLACYFKSQGESQLLAEGVPVILGYGYESLDYVSHRKDGLSHKDSVDNFKRDTRRYREGVAFGNGFCNGN